MEIINISALQTTAYFKNRWIYIACFLYSSFLSFITINRFNNFRAEACDMALFDQLVWNTAYGKIGWITFLNKCYFAEHFSPILILISPLYWIFDDPRLLLVLQSFCLGFSALPLYLIGLEKFNDKKIALIFSISYLITPKLWQANFFDFHQEAFLPLFLFATFYNLIKKNYKSFLLFLFLSFLVREDVAIYSATLSLYAIFVKRFRLLGAVIFIFSIFWGIIVIKFVIPSFSNEAYGIFSTRYTYLGNNFLDIIKTILFNPIVLLKHLYQEKIITTISILFQQVLFLPFLSTTTFLLVIPSIFINIASDYVHQYVLSAAYVLPVLPFLFISSIYGYHNLINIEKFKKLKIFIILLITLLISLTYGPSISDLKINHIFIVLFVIMLFISTIKVLLGKLYIEKYIIWLVLLINIGAWFNQIPNEIKSLKILDCDSHIKSTREMLNLIPKNSAVSAQARLLPHLSHRKHCYLFPYVPVEVEYIALDKKGYTWPLSETDYKKSLQGIMNNTNYEIIFDKDEIILIKVM